MTQPSFLKPGGGSDGWQSALAYSLHSQNPQMATGQIIASNGGRDYRGTSVPSESMSYLGALQFSKSTNINPKKGFQRNEIGPWIKVADRGSDGSIVLTIGLLKSETAELNLVDARGKLLACIHKGYLSKGSRHFRLDIRSFAPGISSAKLRTASGSLTAAAVLNGRAL